MLLVNHYILKYYEQNILKYYEQKGLQQDSVHAAIEAII